jgi:hypothetical protein
MILTRYLPRSVGEAAAAAFVADFEVPWFWHALARSNTDNVDNALEFTGFLPNCLKANSMVE